MDSLEIMTAFAVGIFVVAFVGLIVSTRLESEPTLPPPTSVECPQCKAGRIWEVTPVKYCCEKCGHQVEAGTRLCCGKWGVEK